MYKMYTVYGWHRATDDTVLLSEAHSTEEAIRWIKGYVQGAGGTGGWDKIYVSHLYQTDVDWEGEPVYAEHISYSYWQEPMDYPDNAMEEF